MGSSITVFYKYPVNDLQLIGKETKQDKEPNQVEDQDSLVDHHLT